MSRADLLLEIGTEEIPAGYLPPAQRQLSQNLCALLHDLSIEFEAAAVETFATPRRLAIRIGQVASTQTTRTDLKLGPAVRAAFDAQGKATVAAEGFARSVGAAVADLRRVETDKGERLAYEVTVGGKDTAEMLVAADWRGLLQLGFPKTMRWIEAEDFAFARPIRWLVCLLGTAVVPIRLVHLTAGRVSRGHRTLHPHPVEIDEPGRYETLLEAAHVMVSPARRRESIERQAHALAQREGGRLHADESLLEEVTYLAEHPLGLVGRFPAEVTQVLPREVIITAMRAHQRYFSIERDEGGLLPRFITFRDGGDHGLDNVVEGNQRVLRARLDDAVFYWNEDKSRPSEAKLEQLERIVWLEGQGSVAAKCRRIRDLARELAHELAPDVDRDHLERAALLCKSDLGTEMIKDGKEFTKLQGVMGRYYALEAGEPAPVADAIAEHLYPRFATDRLPADRLSSLVALADRLDSIAGCCVAGFAPTGSQDPYGLRRQALAVLRILQTHDWHLDLMLWIDRALSGFEAAEAARTEAKAAAAAVFWGRLETTLSDLPAEIVRAVLSVSPLDPVENGKAARALAALRGEASFDALLVGAKRCRNILVKEERLAEERLDDQARAQHLQAAARARWERWMAWAANEGSMSFDPARFSEPAEAALAEAVRGAIPRLKEGAARADHPGIFRELAQLGDPISRYFDEVLVNASESEVRQNRLAFLEDIHYLFARFADMSRASAA